MEAPRLSLQCATRIAMTALFLASCLGLVSCQTGAGVEETALASLEEEFLPATYVSNLRLDKGNYPDLFCPETYAVWLGSDVTALRRARADKQGQKVDPKSANAVTQFTANFLVFECHLASAFGDMSIAYDAVGLRGLSVYLATPDGRKITPTQVVVGTPVRETPQGALRKFERTDLLVFQKKDLWMKKPAVSPEAPSARVVFEGYGSTYSFEWPTSTLPAQPWIPNQDEYLKAVKVGFQETYEKLKELGHISQ
jgi:hypothetical protein